MSGLFKKILKTFFTSKNPVSSITIEGLGLLVFDHDEDAWIGSIVFEFGKVRLCLDGNWSMPSADGEIRPHPDAITWACEIAKNTKSFENQVTTFIANHGDSTELFQKFLISRKRKEFDEIHIYKDGSNPLECLVSYISSDQKEIWRAAFSNKIPTSFYSE